VGGLAQAVVCPGFNRGGTFSEGLAQGHLSRLVSGGRGVILEERCPETHMLSKIRQSVAEL